MDGVLFEYRVSQIDEIDEDRKGKFKSSQKYSF